MNQTVKNRERIAYFALALFATLLPFFFVRIPPITDLAQHVAQIRIAIEHFTSESSPYTFQWWTPYTLSGLVFGASWPFGDGYFTGKLGMMIITALSVGSLHLLTKEFDLAPEGALLASLLTLNISFYWGFAAFLVGMGPFALWIIVTNRILTGKSVSKKQAAAAFITSWLLYMSHIFWLTLALVWVALEAVRVNKYKRALPPVLAALPALALTAWWYPSLSQKKFDGRLLQGQLTTGRLDLDWLAIQALGPIVWVSLLAFVCLLAILGTQLIQRKPRLVHPLATAAVIFSGIVLLVPYSFKRTIVVNGRFAGIAIGFWILVAFRKRASKPVVVAILILAFGVGLAKASVWYEFEKQELTGLTAAIEMIDRDEPRVLGLDMVKTSPLLGLRTHPYLQHFAWAQVIHGGQLNFSFAEMAPLPFVYESYEHLDWQRNLEWYPERTRPEDLQYFDYVLLHAQPEDHSAFREKFGLKPVNDEHLWQLYVLEPSKK